MKTTPSELERLNRLGYRCIHLFGNVYLVRNYSVNARKFSLYGLVFVKRGVPQVETGQCMVADTPVERGMRMSNCGQACLYNTLAGCKVKEFNAICPLTNMAAVQTSKPMTNGDRIRAMSDEELAEWMSECNAYKENADASQWLPWLKQTAEGE